MPERFSSRLGLPFHAESGLAKTLGQGIEKKGGLGVVEGWLFLLCEFFDMFLHVV